MILLSKTKYLQENRLMSFLFFPQPEQISHLVYFEYLWNWFGFFSFFFLGRNLIFLIFITGFSTLVWEEHAPKIKAPYIPQ